MAKLFPRVDYQVVACSLVGGVSRHLCSKNRSLISLKGYRKDRRLMQVLEMEKTGIKREVY